MANSHILTRKVNQVETNQWEEIVQIHAPNGGLSGVLETVAITHVLKKDAAMQIQVDGGDVEGGLLCSSINDFGTSDLSLDISFEEDLVVEGKNITRKPASHIQYWVIYSVDEGSMLPQKAEKTKRHGVQYEKNWFKTEGGVEYSVEVPIPLEMVSQTIAEPDTVFEGEKIKGTIRVLRRIRALEDGGQETTDYNIERIPVDFSRFFDQQQDWELEPFEAEEEPRLSVTLPGSDRQVIRADEIDISEGSFEEEEVEDPESKVFSFNFDRYDTMIPGYQGPLEIRATFEGAENLPAIVHLV